MSNLGTEIGAQETGTLLTTSAYSRGKWLAEIGLVPPVDDRLGERRVAKQVAGGEVPKIASVEAAAIRSRKMVKTDTGDIDGLGEKEEQSDLKRSSQALAVIG